MTAAARGTTLCRTPRRPGATSTRPPTARASPTRRGSSTPPATSAPPPARPSPSTPRGRPRRWRSRRLPTTPVRRRRDFITSDTTLTVSGTNGALGAGETIQVSSDGGTTWLDVAQNTATTWSYARPDHRTARASPTRRGSSTPPAMSAPPPARPSPSTPRRRPRRWRSRRLPTTPARRRADFITSDTTLTVSGTNGALGAGEKIQVSNDGGTTWHDVVAGHRHDLELRSTRPPTARASPTRRGSSTPPAMSAPPPARPSPSTPRGRPRRWRSRRLPTTPVRRRATSSPATPR